jgi:hypothetical protein
MRRVLALLTLSVLVGGLLSVVGATSVQAVEPLTGRLVDSTGSHPAVAGATVRLRRVTASGAGEVVASDTTDADGKFSLEAGPSPDDEYYVQVLPGDYQGGYVGDGYVQPTQGGAMTYGAHAALGKVLSNPAFIRGVLVNSHSHRPVRGVRVTARSDNDPSQVEGGDTTNGNGVFRIVGLTCEDDCYLKVAGGPQGYEAGFRACNAQVVATFDDACASPIGRIGKVFLDKS